MEPLLAVLKAASDETRLRILRLALVESLNVGELVRILGCAQSTVSHKLRELREAGLLRERRDGGFSYYEAAAVEASPTVEALAAELHRQPDVHGDLARLREILREREDRGEASSRLVEPGRSWVAWARALRFVLPPLRVADFGCGDGALTAEIAAWARAVLAIERDARALERARRRIESLGLDNVRFVHGDIEGARLKARSLDLVIVSHTLHFCAEPAGVLERAVRVLVPGGRVVVLELLPHAEEWVEAKLGHVHRGFAAAELEKMLAEAGLADIEVAPTPPGSARKPFQIVIASGVRP